MPKENKQIEAMKKLGMTDEEIADVLECDKKIDKGEKLFELSPELEKGAKKARNAGNCKGYTKPTNREKKVDEDKKFIMELITDLISNFAEEYTVNNPERELSFAHNGKKYKIVLSCPRS